METLLASFVAAALCGWGDRAQLLVAAVSGRRRRPAAALGGYALAALAIATVAGVGGALIHPTINATALIMLVALALAFAGVVGLIEPPAPGRVVGFKGGAFATTMLFGFAFLSGGRGQLLIFALAALRDAPLLAVLGGAAGMIAGAVPAALLGHQFQSLPLRPPRIAIAILFLLAALVVVLIARAGA